MIIVLHYILFSIGHPATVIYIALFIQKYSAASLSELGLLLMLMPFLCMILKPIVCALADRQQAHRLYLIGSLILFAMGYGSLVIIPFFPNFYKNNGRLCWYLDMISLVVGNSAFGVVWSLGDALAVKRANVRGITWGAYRVWATISWGVSGFIVGQINELPSLPVYTPGLILLMLSSLAEVVFLIFWNKEHFDMNALEYTDRKAQQEAARKGSLHSSGSFLVSSDDPTQPPAGWKGTYKGTPGGTLKGSARMNSRLVGALANIVMEDVKSSLRIGPAPRRQGLAELLDEHQLNNPSYKLASLPVNSSLTGSPVNGLPQTPATGGAGQLPASTPVTANVANTTQTVNSVARPPVGGAAGLESSETATNKLDTVGRAARRRAQQMLERMNSLSSISGHAIATEIRSKLDSQDSRGSGPTQMMVMSSLASSASLSRTAAARALGLSLKESPVLVAASAVTPAQVEEQAAVIATNYKSVEDLQLILLKLIIKRDLSIYKYLVMFVLLGGLVQVHMLYFFMHVEAVSVRDGYNFSQTSGVYLVAQSVSEVFSFLIIVPKLMPLLGRTGSFLFISLVYFIRYAYYATYFDQFSPYWAIITETCHGLGYGVAYSLITEISVEYVDRVDRYLPELIRRGLVDPGMSGHQLKLPLRATMQGLFSGTFDGCGSGLGAVLAGAYLDLHPGYVDLWAICSYILVGILIVYPLIQWRDFVPAQWNRKKEEAKEPELAHEQL